MVMQVIQGAKMTPQEFCYWLQGLLELSPDLKNLNEAQMKMIREHLGYVFSHLPTTQYTYTAQDNSLTMASGAVPNVVTIC